MQLKGTKVFKRTWAAANERKKVLDEEGQEKLVRKYKIILGEGSSRSSKTWSYFIVFFLWAATYYNKRLIILRKTAAECRANVEPEFKDWLQDPLARYKQYERGEITRQELDDYLEEEDLTQYITLSRVAHKYTINETGSEIIFTGGDNVNKIIGPGFNCVWVNEPYDFPEEMLNQLLQRTTDFCLLDWNPKESHYIERFKKRDNCKVIYSTFRDNPFCPEEARNHILSYLPLDNKFIKPSIKNLAGYAKLPQEKLEAALEAAGIEGQPYHDAVLAWNNERQGTASAWHWSVFGLGMKAERPNRIFKWNEIPDSEYNSLDVATVYVTDWGVVDPWGVVELKYYDGALYCHEINYMSENEVRLNLERTQRRQVDDQDQEGLVSYFFSKVLAVPKSRPVICDNNRPMKVRALRKAGYEYAIATKKYPGSIIDGINLLLDVKVYYTASSLNIGYEQENYSRKTDPRTGEVLEEPLDANNHTIDAIRYGAQHLHEIGIIKI